MAVNKKAIVVGALAVAGFEAYRAYSISNSIILTYNNFRLSISKGQLVINFNAVITNQSGKSVSLLGVSGNVQYTGNTLINFTAKNNNPIELITGKTVFLPITVTTNSVSMISMIAAGTGKKITLNYNIGVGYSILGLLPVTVPVKFSQVMDLSAYINAAKGLVAGLLNLLKAIPKDAKVTTEVITVKDQSDQDY